MALKTSDALVVALCPTCHSKLDQGREMDRAERREFWDQAFIRQMQTLIESGALKA